MSQPGAVTSCRWALKPADRCRSLVPSRHAAGHLNLLTGIKTVPPGAIRERHPAGDNPHGGDMNGHHGAQARQHHDRSPARIAQTTELDAHAVGCEAVDRKSTRL